MLSQFEYVCSDILAENLEGLLEPCDELTHVAKQLVLMLETV